MKRQQIVILLLLNIFQKRGRSKAFLLPHQRIQRRRFHQECPSQFIINAKKTEEVDDQPESSNFFRNIFASSEADKEKEVVEERSAFGRWKDAFSNRDKSKQSSKVDSNKLRNVKKSRRRDNTNESKATNSSWINRIQESLPFASNSTKTVDKMPKATSSTSNNPFAFVQNLWKNNETSPAAREEWVSVFSKTRIMPGESVPVTVNGLDLLVVASLDGRSLYCIQNSCPHLGTPLETGELKRLPIEDDRTSNNRLILSETDVTNLLSQDGCEDCIVCPLHKTAFALRSGQVRGEWCPYPPILGAVMGTVKQKNAAAVFDVRTRGKDVQVRFNSPL